MSTPTHLHPPTTPGHLDEQLRDEARESAPQLRSSHVYEAVFAAGIVAIFLVNVLTSGVVGVSSEWSSWWFAFGW